MSDNSENNKRVAKNTMMLYIRMFFTMAITLYTSRVILAKLGVVDYGIYNVVGGFVSMFSMISGAMTTATQRFLSFEIGKGDKGNVEAMFSTAVIIHLILALIVLIFAETIGLMFINTQMNFAIERYFAVNWVYQFSVFTFIVNVISVPYNAAIIANEKMSTFAYVSIIDVILKLLILYLLDLSPIDKLIFYSALLALVAMTIRIIYGLYCTKFLQGCRCNWRMDKVHRRNMLSFVSWNLIGELAGVLREQGINVLLNVFFGAGVNAARGIAYQVLAAVRSFVSNFQLAMNPPIVKYYAANEKDNMYSIVFRGSKISFMLVITMALPIILEAPFILKIWLNIVPDNTILFLRIILVTAIISSLSGTLITLMHASGKVKDYQIVVGSLSLMTLPFAFILLKIGLGPHFALISGLIIETICLFARMFMLRRSVSFPVSTYFKKVLLRVLPIAVLSPVLPFTIKIALGENLTAFLIVIASSIISSIGVSYYIGFTRNEQLFVKEKLSLVLLKLNIHAKYINYQ